jgi:hypothetical protein
MHRQPGKGLLVNGWIAGHPFPGSRHPVPHRADRGLDLVDDVSLRAGQCCHSVVAGGNAAVRMTTNRAAQPPAIRHGMREAAA